MQKSVKASSSGLYFYFAQKELAIISTNHKYRNFTSNSLDWFYRATTITTTARKILAKTVAQQTTSGEKERFAQSQEIYRIHTEMSNYISIKRVQST